MCEPGFLNKFLLTSPQKKSGPRHPLDFVKFNSWKKHLVIMMYYKLNGQVFPDGMQNRVFQNVKTNHLNVMCCTRSFKLNKVLYKELKLKWLMCASKRNLLCNILGALHPARKTTTDECCRVFSFFLLFSLLALQCSRPEIKKANSRICFCHT